MSVPMTFAWSRSILAPFSSQVVTCDPGASIAPLGRLFSCAHPIVGTLNCICGVSAFTSSPVSFANGAYTLAAAGLVLTLGGAVSLPAAAHAAAPTFFATAARCVARSCVPGATEPDGAGVGDAADALGLGDGAPPPWPPLDVAGLLVAAGALPVGAAPLGAAAGGLSAVALTSPVALRTLRNRICAAWPTFLSWSLASPARDTTMLRLPS